MSAVAAKTCVRNRRLSAGLQAEASCPCKTGPGSIFTHTITFWYRLWALPACLGVGVREGGLRRGKPLRQFPTCKWVDVE